MGFVKLMYVLHYNQKFRLLVVIYLVTRRKTKAAWLGVLLNKWYLAAALFILNADPPESTTD